MSQLPQSVPFSEVKKLDCDTVTALLTIFNNVKDHLSIVGMDYTYRQVNHAYERAFDIGKEQIVGRKISDVFGNEVFMQVIKPNLDLCFSGEEVIYRQDFNFPGYCGERFMEVRYQPIFSKEASDSERVVAVVVSSHDLTLMKKTTDQLNDLARIDALTGLPNRRALDEGLERFDANFQRTGGEFTVIFIGLDDFKIINDLHGHKIGDEVLHILGQRFRDSFRKDEIIGRYGGDEFISIIPGCMNDLEFKRFKDRLSDDIEKPVNVMGHIIKPRISVGAASVPRDGEDIEAILNDADQAMYAHKLSKSK